MMHFGRTKLITIFMVVLLGVMYSVPNLVPESQRYQLNEAGELAPQGIWQYIPSRTINLGLDLQGGSHIVFQVDMDEVKEQQLQSLRADVEQALSVDGRRLHRSVAVVGEEVVAITVQASDRDTALEQIRDLSQPVEQTASSFTIAQTLVVTSGGEEEPRHRRGPHRTLGM